MLIRELKLKINKKQETLLNDWLWILTGVHNWAIRKIELDAKDKRYYSELEFYNILRGHSKKLNIPSHTISAIVSRSWRAWDKCIKNKLGKPRLKSTRNKLRSIPFPDEIPLSRITTKTIRLPNLGHVRYFKQELPKGKIKNGRIIKRASGWYLQLCIDTKHIFTVKKTKESVGIDTGFKDLAILSNGIKYSNQKNFIKEQKRLAQAQRGRNKKLTARLHERIANRRKDYNHKVSKEIVQNYNEIHITNDNLRNQAKMFGKSVMDAGISQLRKFIIYKGDSHGRKVNLVSSKNTTMTCSNCFSLTGPTGLGMLNVRSWECRECGSHHDRDINAAKVVLNFGLGYSLVNQKLLGGSNE